MPTFRLSYYPDITQHRTPQEVREAVVGFAATLSAELTRRAGASHTVGVLDVLSVPEQTAMMAAERCEIGLIKPSSYVFAHRRNPKVVPAAVALRAIDGKIGDTYFAQLYTHTATNIHNMNDLRERCLAPREQRPSIGFGDSFSTANFLVPAAILLAHGLHPLTRFRLIEFLGGHDGVAQAVFRREVDIGAGHDGVIVDLARQPGFAGADKQLIQLARRDIHSDPVAVAVSPDVKQLLADSLIAIGAREDVKTQLDIFWGAVRGLGPTEHKNYASIEEAINDLRISEADILGL